MISELAYVNPGAKIGANVTIHPFAYIDDNVEIGDNCVIYPYASVMAGTRIGVNTKIYQAAVIGADPQDPRWMGEHTECHIGDNVIIREQVIINRGIKSEGGTVIGSDCRIMAQSHIGHDTVIQGPCVIGNGVMIAGDVTINGHTVLSSSAVVHEGSSIGQWTLIKGGCRISGNVPPYCIIAHNPATYYGVNATIMRKRGFSEDDIDNAAKAFRHLYQTQTSVFNAIRRIEADIEDNEIRRNIVNFIRDNKLKIVGIKDLTID